MVSKRRTPVFLFLWIIVCVCLMMLIRRRHDRKITDRPSAFVLHDKTNGQSQYNRLVAPLLRVTPKHNSKTGEYGNEIITNKHVPAPPSTKLNDHNKPKKTSQHNDVTNNKTSQGNVKQTSTPRNASTSITNGNKSTKSQLHQPKVIKLIKKLQQFFVTVKCSNWSTEYELEHGVRSPMFIITGPEHSHNARCTYILAKLELNPRFDIPQQPDEVYAVPDLQTLRLEPDERKLPTFVLLVTYARSGSTWLGSITSKAENSMYVFEPFQWFKQQGYYKMNEVCFFNDTCSSPTAIIEKHEFFITQLYRLFTCQLRKLHIRMLEVFIRNIRTRSMKNSLDSCIQSNNSYTLCLRELEEKCLQTEQRILKTIRVAMELVPIMLDLWPNLKILHLSRDPRGITNSRQHSGRVFSNSRSIYPHSRALCRLMFNDIEIDKLISKTFPGRSKILLYEALAERPIEGAKYIYDFIGANATDQALKWIHNSSRAAVKKESYYGTYRTNSSKTAYRWRNELKLSDVQVIDTTCARVYERLGFLPLNTMDKLKSFDIPSRTRSTHEDGFV